MNRFHLTLCLLVALQSPVLGLSEKCPGGLRSSKLCHELHQHETAQSTRTSNAWSACATIEPRASGLSQCACDCHDSGPGAYSKPTRCDATGSPSVTGQDFFTSITAKFQTGLETCAALPTPTSSLQKIAVDQENLAGMTFEVFLSENGTEAKYVAGVGEDDIKYIFDVSNPNRFAIMDDKGNSFYLDDSGIHVATSDCSLVLDLEIENFKGQVTELTGKSFTRRTVEKRFVNTKFDVALDLRDICDNPVTDIPSLGVGATPCELISEHFSTGESDWSCQFPGEESKELQCENSVKQILNPLTGGLTGSITGWPAIVKRILKPLFLRYGRTWLAALVITAGILLTPVEFDILLGLGAAVSFAIDAYAIVQVIINVLDWALPGGLAQYLCMMLHESEFPIPLTLEVRDTIGTLQLLSSAPTGIIHEPVTLATDCSSTSPVSTTSSRPSSTESSAPALESSSSTMPSQPTSLVEKSGWKFTFGQSDQVNAWTPEASYFIPITPGGPLSVNTRCLTIEEVTFEGMPEEISPGALMVWETKLDPVPPVTQPDSCCIRLSAGSSCETGGDIEFLEDCNGFNTEATFPVTSFQVYRCTGLYVA